MRGPWLALVLVGCSLGYGPPRDKSRVVSAKLMPDGHTCLFSYHRLVYRPATGLRAFPDGGIPRYVSDRRYIGIVDTNTGGQQTLRTLRNTDWQPGHAAPHITHVHDGYALLSEGGQRRDGYDSDHRIWGLTVPGGVATPMDLRAELAKRGRALGAIHLLEPDGTLLVHGPPLGAKTPRELWLRDGAGTWTRIGPAHDYYGYREGVLHFWSLDRLYHWYDVASGTERTEGGRTHPDLTRPDVTRDCKPSGAALDVGVRVNGTWSYQPLVVDPSRL